MHGARVAISVIYSKGEDQEICYKIMHIPYLCGS